MRIVVFIMGFVIIVLTLSCDNNPQQKFSKLSNNEPTKIEEVINYTGNAFIFFDTDIYRNRCFIIPVNDIDSNSFKTISVNKVIKNRICIQMFFGHSDLMKLVDNSKEIIGYKACNLPKDSMLFSRAFISYKNCVEMRSRNMKTSQLKETDSCNSKLVERTDSTQFNFSIYKIK